MKINYSYKPSDEGKAVKAMGKNLNISFKHAVVICKALKGMKLDDAMKYLDDVIAFKNFIPCNVYNTNVGHRKRVGGVGGPGRYPIKSCKEVLKLLRSAEKNAEKKPDVDIKNLKITHIQALKGPSRAKRRPKGRYRIWRTQYTHIQVVLECQ